MVDLNQSNRKEEFLMNKIDRRHHFVMVCDTETANTFRTENGQLDASSALVYDCGWCVMDTKGTIYEERSFVNSDIFTHETEMMNSSYYANKLPRYYLDLVKGSRTIATTYEIRKAMLEDLENYGIKEVMAHNARFDCNALNSTQRWITKSRFRYWFPYDIEIWDTMKMARDVICKMPTYRRFCENNNLLTKTGKVSASAENLYRFIIKDPTFIESHTGLEDVQIEREIFLYCMRQHKKMRKKLWEN